jgi:hypothetical protein
VLQRAPLPSEVEAILQQFPGPVTLHPGFWKVLIGSAIALFAVVLGVFGIKTGTWAGVLSGGFIALFFGIGAPVAIWASLRGMNDLRLTRDGFEFPRTLRGCKRHQWRDVQDFAPMYVGKMWHVAYNDETRKRSWMGHNALLPDTYRLGAANLAMLMAAWRQRALAGAQGSSSVSQ